MAESIVKIPSTASSDFDFLAFSFGGKHSYDDFGIYRTSGGDRYEEKLVPNMNDKTAEVPNGDGMYYFNTTYKQREFPISFAFDHLTEEQLRGMRRWLNGKELGDLWFEEAPYKVYTAKVTGQPSIKVIPFDETYTEGGVQKKRRIYKGEGNVTFTAYWPYAHTPRGEIETTFYSPKIEVTEEDNSKDSISFNITDEKIIKLLRRPGGTITIDTDGTFEHWTFGDKTTGGYVEDYLTTDSLAGLDYNSLKYDIEGPQNMTYARLEIAFIFPNGKSALVYFTFANADQFLPASGLNNDPQDGENPGDIPAPFILSKSGDIAKDAEFKVGELSIKLLIDTHNLKWDSKTGIVSGTEDVSATSERKPIPVTGNPCGGIPVGGLTASEITPSDVTLEYDYWYY